MTTIRQGTVKSARKIHRCTACDVLTNYITRRGNPFTFAEWRHIVKAKQNNWYIQHGESYEYYINVDSGELFYAKCIPEILKIAEKYDCFGD